MMEDVVIPERLLDHEQIEIIKFAQAIEISRTIGRVRIAAQHNIRPAVADLRKYFQVPPRLHFYFNSLVARRQLCLNLFQKLFMRILNSNGNSASNLGKSSAEQSPKRLLLLLSFRIPKRIFQSGLRHIVAAHPRHQLSAIFAALNLGGEQRWSQEVADRFPRSLDPFVAVKRPFAGNTLTPAINAFTMRRDQQYAAAFCPPKAGLKEVFQRHVQLAKGDGFELHACSLCRWCRRGSCNRTTMVSSRSARVTQRTGPYGRK